MGLFPGRGYKAQGCKSPSGEADPVAGMTDQTIWARLGDLAGYFGARQLKYLVTACQSPLLLWRGYSTR
ncbi:MAG: hypothetical protein CL876_06495 [Dehalococcoidales bacterium]|nr:hypothetical protein [Dehalococcoidales bacterium]